MESLIDGLIKEYNDPSNMVEDILEGSSHHIIYKDCFIDRLIKKEDVVYYKDDVPEEGLMVKEFKYYRHLSFNKLWKLLGGYNDNLELDYALVYKEHLETLNLRDENKLLKDELEVTKKALEEMTRVCAIQKYMLSGNEQSDNDIQRQ